jgi:pterin-4a-carbinolamine dehydratase
VTVELQTAAIGGLTENDFIVAAKADALSLTDLVAQVKKRTFYI